MPWAKLWRAAGIRLIILPEFVPVVIGNWYELVLGTVSVFMQQRNRIKQVGGTNVTPKVRKIAFSLSR
ncbi:MAG: hypothetical protein MUF81_18425 [Verrucomicrobia bacterium]|jgi:hypothetical protein|nr:hypothetical protein [Verrucomicrobiota bacterium]